MHPGLPLVGSVFRAWSDPLGLLFAGAREQGDLVQFRFGPFTYVLVNEAEAVQHVLVKNANNYVKSRNYAGIKRVLGQGLLTSEGATWRRRRKLVQPTFHPRAHRAFVDVFAEGAFAALDRWEREREDGSTFDVHAEMMRLTLRLVGKTLFATDLDDQAAEIGDALGVALRWAQDHAEAVVRWPPWVPTPGNFRFRRALAQLDAAALRILRERRARGDSADGGATDVLGMLLAARDDHGVALTDEELRDEVLTLTLAGHETTATALTWTLLLLSQHPDIERRLHDEVRSVLGGRPPRFDDLPRLEYTERVLAESMRLLPPAWCLERDALEEDVVGGHRIPKGATVAVCPYLLHRHPRYWDNPEGFDPERFTRAASEARPRFAYIPFGDGPRVCIGRSFALIEAKVALAAIVSRARLELEPGFPIELEPGITLRPRHGMRMKLKFRKGDAARERRESAPGAAAPPSPARCPHAGGLTTPGAETAPPEA